MDDHMRVAGLLEVNAALQGEKAARIEGSASERDRAAAEKRQIQDQAMRQSMASRGRVAMLEKALGDANAALAHKDALLKEWMHSNEAFKRLARKYGKHVGVSQEQWQNDVDDVVLEVAEEKPEFADTRATKAVKEARGIK
jgi:hypothetical protein